MVNSSSSSEKLFDSRESTIQSHTTSQLYSWCRWRTYINQFLIHRMNLASLNKTRKVDRSTSYFVIMRGIEVPPVLMRDQRDDLWRQTPTTLEAMELTTMNWHLKHGVPRAKLTKRPVSLPSSWSSFPSLTNSEVSFDRSSGHLWTSNSSLESERGSDRLRYNERRKETNQKQSKKHLLSWSRLKLKLAKRNSRTRKSETVSEAPSHPPSANLGDSSEGRTRLRRNSSDSTDSNYSIKSGKFPFTSNIFLPEAQSNDQTSQQKKSQGRVFVNLQSVNRNHLGGKPQLKHENESESVRVPGQVAAEASRPRIRMYERKVDQENRATREYADFMFNGLQQLYGEDADKLTNLRKDDTNAKKAKYSTASATADRSIRYERNTDSQRLASGYHVENYGRF